MAEQDYKLLSMYGDDAAYSCQSFTNSHASLPPPSALMPAEWSTTSNAYSGFPPSSMQDAATVEYAAPPHYSTLLSPCRQNDYRPLEPEQFYFPVSDIPTRSSTQGANSSSRGDTSRKGSRHLTTKEETSYQCQVKGCGKLFNRSYNFKAHMETHQENREYPFPCPVHDCSKKFGRRTDLQRHHQSVHTKERNYKCDHCGRQFARKDTLRRHVDDGCSKRFDMGTLYLQADGYGIPGPATRSMELPADQATPPPGYIHPMTVSHTGSSGGIGSSPRTSQLKATKPGTDSDHFHTWGYR